MKHIHIVNPYGSSAMQRMTSPLYKLSRLYVVSEGRTPDEGADLNYHVPYHMLIGKDLPGKQVIAYTHCNPPDAPALIDACNRADKIICMSFQGRKELVEIGIDSEKIHVIYSAADGFQFRKKNIGVVGFVQPNGRKREGLLLDLAWTYDLNPFNLIVVGGGWGPTVQALNNLNVSVQWLEFADDEQMRDVYKTLDALLVTGYAEGGPLPLLEAMMSGVPVISPPFGYAADLLPDNMMYNTVEELTECLNRIAEQSILSHQLMKSWTWADYAAEHALIFGRLLNESVDLFPNRAVSRYAQILDVIDEYKPVNIVEIGTWKGDRAIQMIQQAAKYHRIQEINYHGFDLFEMQTGEQFRRELSKWGWPVKVVRKRIEATGANVELVQGDTNHTINRMKSADLYFIDGGHSEATIRNDWEAVKGVMHSDSVVIFDDYYYRGGVGVGCKNIIDGLDANIWKVEHLPQKTLTDDGRQIGMVKVTRKDNANLRVQMSTRTYSRNTASDSGNGKDVHLSGVFGYDVESTADTKSELERTTPPQGTADAPGSKRDD